MTVDTPRLATPILEETSPGSATKRSLRAELIVLLIAAFVFLPGLLSPPHLMDDVDAAQAQQAKNMVLTGDWVTQRLDGVLYLEKAPLKYWATATLYEIFGIHDWVARIPTVFSAILLCLLVVRIGRWASSEQVGLYSGLVLATSLGLFLFTRTVIPDLILTLFVATSVWCFLRATETAERSRGWALGAFASMACGLLTKGLIGVAFPIGIVLTYLLATKKLFSRETWRSLHIASGILVFLVIAAPWHILAILRNPPYFDTSLHVGPNFGGKFRGFFWFYFINEQLLRFLNERWPRDYNTVPRLWFWLYQLLWFYPWSLFAPALARLKFGTADRASRLNLLALCWIGVVMVFFTFSTTQEYYSMPIYPAIALLLGSAMTKQSKWLTWGTRMAGAIAAAGCVVICGILVAVRNLPTPGDIAGALSEHPELYTLSLGHAADLTIPAFAYLRLPLAMAALAFLVGAAGSWIWKRQRAYLAIAAMLVIFAQAARSALIVFDPYLSSYPLAHALQHSPKGTVILYDKYNPYSSIFFYTEDKALIVDGDLDILEYGSYAPGAPHFALTEPELQKRWHSQERYYLVVKDTDVARVERTLGAQALHLVIKSGGKRLFTNMGATSAAQ